jgi:hypothetical protein
MPNLVQDESGQVFIDQGGGKLMPVSEDEARYYSENEGALSAAAESAQSGLNQIISGGLSLATDSPEALQLFDEFQRRQEVLGTSSPVATAAGGVVPALAAGVAMSPLGLPAVMAGEGVLGAAQSPRDPLTGAAIGAGTVGGLAVGGRLLQAAAQQAPMPALGITGRQIDNSTATGRVLGAMDQAAAPAGGPRVHEGLLTADELEVATGTRLSTGRRMQLEALAGNPEQIQAAMRQRYVEDLRGKQGGWLGEQQVTEVNQLRGALDDAVRQATGIPQGVAFNDAVVGQQLRVVGDEIGQVMNQVQWVEVPRETIGEMTEALASRTKQAAGPVKTQVEEMQRLMDEQGHLTSGQYQDVYRKLGKIVEAQEGGTALLAEQVRKQLEDVVEKQAGAAVKQQLQQARYKYRVLKRLMKPGAVGPDGSINAQSFRRSLQKGTSDKRKGTDPIAKLAETINTVTAPTVHTGNTLQRFIDTARANAPTTVTRYGTAGAVGTAGLSAIGGLLGM